MLQVRLLKLKNPWSHLRWRGRYSELDTKRWTPELQRHLHYDPGSAAQFDNGVFWIDYDSVCAFFDVFYMNWNPELFKCTFCIHQYDGTDREGTIDHSVSTGRGTPAPDRSRTCTASQPTPSTPWT